jgi:hypothetical protein
VTCNLPQPGKLFPGIGLSLIDIPGLGVSGVEAFIEAFIDRFYNSVHFAQEVGKSILVELATRNQ